MPGRRSRLAGRAEVNLLGRGPLGGPRPNPRVLLRLPVCNAKVQPRVRPPECRCSARATDRCLGAGANHNTQGVTSWRWAAQQSRGGIRTPLTAGKGRKQRITPLTSGTVATVRVWVAERGGAAADPLFPTRRGGRLSRDALERRLAKHVAAAACSCPTLTNKRITLHVLRHTAAMRLLRAGVDSSVIALWLGHESVETTQIHLHADMAIKERALARTAPLNSVPGRYRPTDAMLAFLESL